MLAIDLMMIFLGIIAVSMSMAEYLESGRVRIFDLYHYARKRVSPLGNHDPDVDTERMDTSGHKVEEKAQSLTDIDNVKTLFGGNDAKNLRYYVLSREAQEYRSRLTFEIESLNKRGNTNLIIASVTTLAAVTILLYSVLNPLKSANIYELLSYYVPRVSLILLIEVFSFFFLKLYRNSLVDIRFYQNELTNFEFKIMSLKVALFEEDKSLLSSMLTEYSKTERNAVLKSDEAITTTSLQKFEGEKDRFFTDNFKSLTESVSALAEKVMSLNGKGPDKADK
ncbi:hypothetical protein [Spirosoma pulveris]